MGEERADHAAEGDDGAEGKVHAAGQEDERHPDRQDAVDGHLAGDVGEVRGRRETIRGEGQQGGDDDKDHDDADAVAEVAVEGGEVDHRGMAWRRISSWLVWRGLSSAESSPCRRTRMRWVKARISGSSDETSNTAVPWAERRPMSA